MHCQPEKKTLVIGPVQHAVEKDTETPVNWLSQGRDIASCLVPERERERPSLMPSYQNLFPYPHYFTKTEFLFYRRQSTDICLKYDF